MDKVNRDNVELVFLCGARDFHAMDWYKSAKEVLGRERAMIVTDLIAGEGYKKLIDDTDNVHNLLILDKFLPKRQSKAGHIWRNILKLLVFPLQVARLKAYSSRHPHAIYHAHAMYYLFLARAAKVPFVGTPQGSDVLLKPDRSRLFKKYAVLSMQSARAVTCDSEKMKTKIKELSGVNAHIIQNGIDIKEIQGLKDAREKERKVILSIRGFTGLYRMKEMLSARNSSAIAQMPITFVYPFRDDDYFSETQDQFLPDDVILGRLDRREMYELLLQTKLVISIPRSDSSPRSVYESIFCGAAVAITHNPYYDLLPDCMKSRVIIISLEEKDWFFKAVSKASSITQTPFIPSEEALDRFDQRRSFERMSRLLFD